MAELKTKATKASVTEFINAIEDDERRADCKNPGRMMTKATKAKPVMWGPAIVGFGDHEYIGANGKSTKWFQVGFSPRKQALSLYLMGGKDKALLAKLGESTDRRRLPLHQASRRRASPDAAEADHGFGEASARRTKNKGRTEVRPCDTSAAAAYRFAVPSSPSFAAMSSADVAGFTALSMC